MIPFAIFTRIVLDSGIVRVDFKLSQWQQRGDDWVYFIPNSVHLSGDVPKVIITDQTNHTAVLVGVEYNYAGMITLVAKNPIQNFIGYFMGDGFIIPNDKPFKFFDINDGSETFFDIRTNELYYMGSVGTQPLVIDSGKEIVFASTYRDMVHYIDGNNDLWIYGSNSYGQKGIGSQTGIITIDKCFSNVKQSYSCVMPTSSSAENFFSVLLTLNGDVYVTGSASNFQCIGIGVASTTVWTKLTIPEPIDRIVVSNTTFCIGQSGKIYMFGFNAHGQIPDTANVRGNVYEQTNIPLNSPVFVSCVGTFYTNVSEGVVYSAGWQPNIGRPAGAGWQPTNLPADVIKITGNFMYSGGAGNNFALTQSGQVWMTGIVLPMDAHTTLNTWEKFKDSGVSEIYSYSHSFNSTAKFCLLTVNTDGTHTQYNTGGGSIPDLYQLPFNN